MADYYIYLMASLPALSFGAKPPLTFDAFLGRCNGLIPDRDLDIVRSAKTLGYTCADAKNVTLKKWIGFDMMLRNELVKIRAVRKKMDPAKYLREDGCPESIYAAHIAINAYRKSSLIDAEKALDLARWQYLEDLAMGHYFDIDSVIIYACKLVMLEKWDKIQSAEKEKMLEEVL